MNIHNYLTKRPGAGNGKLIAGISVMCITLLISVGMILLFLHSVEYRMPEEPESDEPEAYGVTPVPSKDMLPIERFMTKNKLAELLDGTVARPASGDEGVFWLFDKTTPSATMASDFHIYLGKSGDVYWGRLVAGCTLKRPVAARRITIDTDGELYEIPIEPGERSTKFVDYVEGVHESVDLPLSGYTDIAARIARADDVTVCFVGDEDKYSYKLTMSQIQAVARMVRILALEHDLAEDAAVRAERKRKREEFEALRKARRVL